jgi:acetyl-CoA carboxylase biotin carboxylase subunit
VIKRLLIANRGEIAVRIIRSCREMGIETVAVYSTADRNSLHVRLAGRAVCIGPPAPAKSYLVKENLVMAALHTGCEAIHPGAGFLSENAEFARFAEEAGLVFIGPGAEVIELLGDKVRAREAAKRYGLPVTPGTGVVAPDPAGSRAAEEAALSMGFPVIIKAAAGGGGRGMRIVRRPEDLAENLSIARAEAEANFACGDVFIEKYLENPRHVELQILADGQGTTAVLGERDCTVQNNHQKLIEESPSPGITEDMRNTMISGALPVFRELQYRGAGTMEFLVEKDSFYFMEVNPRIQVEHPVSEAVSGVDIVRQQILSCTEGRMETGGGLLPLSGWALECRINALGPGTVTRLEVPGGPGVRFDSYLYQGCAVSPHYDSLAAKIIVHGPDRQATLARMDRALGELRIEGIQTNAGRQRWIVNHPVFTQGVFGVSWYAQALQAAGEAGTPP